MSKQKTNQKATEEQPALSGDEVKSMLLDRLKQPGRCTEFGSIEWCGHHFILGEPLTPEQAEQIEEDNRAYRKQQDEPEKKQ